MDTSVEDAGLKEEGKLGLPALEPLWELWEDGTVAGLRRRLINRVKHKFSLPVEFAEDVVGDAFDLAVRTVSEGKEIRNLGAWFYRVVDRCASKRIRHAQMVERQVEGSAPTMQAVPMTFEQRAEIEQRDEVLLAKALSHATEMAPCVGTGQVRDVYDLFLEAVRNDLVDGVPEWIAETLGISVRQVRTLIHRALTRLKAEATRQGVVLPEPIDPTRHQPYHDKWGDRT